MICGTVGYDFSVGAFAVLMICPISFAIGNLLLRRAQGVPMFDLFAWLCLVAAIPLVPLTLFVNGPQADLARAVAYVADRPRLHALHRRRSPPASPIGCGAGCCAITPRRRWCRSRCWCRSSARRRRASCSAKRFGPLRLAGMVTVVCGIAIMLLSKRPQASTKQVLPKIA